MSLIISSGKMIRDEAHRRGQAAVGQFRSAIRPIYRGDGKSMPTHVGTSTLFRIGETKFIATAAHIIDQHTELQLWIGGTHTLIPLTGMFSSTLAPDGNR
jgi:hypothetical protein